MNRRDAFWALAGAIWTGRAAWAAASEFKDELWTDMARSRSLPVRLRWPAGDAPCGLVVYSHGLGGSRAGGAVWGEAWQAAGLAVLHVQHPGSDTEIWSAGLRGVRQGAAFEQYVQRVADAHFVFDELDRLHAQGGAWKRLRPDALGFAGHSFGARLTQAVAGEMPPRARRADVARLADPRPRAFIAFSPGFSSRDGTDDGAVRARFGAITRPFLCVTGTKDDAMIVGDADNAARRAVYRGLPAGQKAQLVLAGADHMTFGGGTGMAPGRRGLPRAAGAADLEPQHRQLVAEITADWWRWRLLDDEAAAARLRRPAGLASGDVWELG